MDDEVVVGDVPHPSSASRRHVGADDGLEDEPLLNAHRTDALESDGGTETIVISAKKIRDDHNNDTEFVTLDDAMTAMGWGRFQMRIFILCGMGNFVEAVETSAMGILFPVLKQYWKLSNWHLAAVGASTVIGMLVGAVVLGRVSDTWGRRPVFQMSLFVSSLFAFFSAMAPNVYTFMALRFCLGFGYGGNIVTDVVLLAELLPVHRRGVFVSLLNVYFGVGALLSVTAAFLIIPHFGWRAFIAFTAIPPFLMLFFRRGVPESPRFLLLQTEEQQAAERGLPVEETGPGKAKQVLLDIAAENETSQDIVEKIRRMKLKPIRMDESTRNEHAPSLSSYAALFTSPRLRVTTILLGVCWFFDAYAASIYTWLPLYISENKSLKGTGTPMDRAYRAAIYLAVGSLVGSLVLGGIVHRFDRRGLLGGGLMLMAMITFSLMILRTAGGILLLLPVAAMIKDSVIQMLYVYTPEVYPTAVRTTALGFHSAFHRFAPAVAHFSIAVMLSISFNFAVIVFGSCYVIAFISAMLLPYDTRNQVLASHFYEKVDDVDKATV